MFTLVRLIALCCALLLTSTAHATRWHRVIHIYDGDTVQIDDQRRVRFIGINTPEIAHEGKPAEPGGDAAKAFLVRYFQQHGDQISLEFDATKHDRYHRLLAYPTSRDGSSPSKKLLEAGHAHVMLYPPNISQTRDQLLWENKARNKALGIWRLASYQIIDEADIGEHVGFVRLRMQIDSAKRRGKSWTLTTKLGLRVRIPARNRTYFNSETHAPTALVGQQLVVRGNISRNRHGTTFWLNHPLQIEAFEAVN